MKINLMVAKNSNYTEFKKLEKKYIKEKGIFFGSCGLEPPNGIYQILKKRSNRNKIMEYMNCGQKVSFNREL